MDYTIYLIENEVNGKQYVGMTCNSPEWRWKKHVGLAEYSDVSWPLPNAIRKQGEDAFQVTEVDGAPTREEAAELERKWIDRLGATETGYNVRPGGEGFPGGEDCPHAKLSADEVLEIRQRYVENDDLSSYDLAEEYGMEIKHILRGDAYQNVPMPDGMEEAMRQTSRQARARGDDHHSAHFNEEEVLRLRREFVETDLFREEIREEYGVSETTVYELLTGKTYGHLPIPDGIEQVMKRKERQLKSERYSMEGESHSQSKLGKQDVREIRHRYENENVSYSDLGEEYGVDSSTIGPIVRQETWTHI